MMIRTLRVPRAACSRGRRLSSDSSIMLDRSVRDSCRRMPLLRPHPTVQARRGGIGPRRRGGIDVVVHQNLAHEGLRRRHGRRFLPGAPLGRTWTKDVSHAARVAACRNRRAPRPLSWRPGVEPWGCVMAETTTDHEAIRKWAESKGGRPAAVDHSSGWRRRNHPSHVRESARVGARKLGRDYLGRVL